MQKEELRQDTDSKRLSVVAGMLGLGTIDQLEPFHSSAKVTLLLPKLPPTAMHGPAGAHDTP